MTTAFQANAFQNNAFQISGQIQSVWPLQNEDGGYGEHLGRQIDRRRDAAREHDIELDRAIEWAINPPVDEAAIAAAEEQAMRQSYAAERIIQSIARRQEEDDAMAVLLMVI